MTLGYLRNLNDRPEAAAHAPGHTTCGGTSRHSSGTHAARTSGTPPGWPKLGQSSGHSAGWARTWVVGQATDRIC